MNIKAKCPQCKDVPSSVCQTRRRPTNLIFSLRPSTLKKSKVSESPLRVVKAFSKSVKVMQTTIRSPTTRSCGSHNSWSFAKMASTTWETWVLSTRLGSRSTRTLRCRSNRTCSWIWVRLSTTTSTKWLIARSHKLLPHRISKYFSTKVSTPSKMLTRKSHQRFVPDPPGSVVMSPKTTSRRKYCSRPTVSTNSPSVVQLNAKFRLSWRPSQLTTVLWTMMVRRAGRSQRKVRTSFPRTALSSSWNHSIRWMSMSPQIWFCCMTAWFCHSLITRSEWTLKRKTVILLTERTLK